MHFIPDKLKMMTKENAVFKGNNYRISVLSERLIRLEYSVDGQFSDALTTLVAIEILKFLNLA